MTNIYNYTDHYPTRRRRGEEVPPPNLTTVPHPHPPLPPTPQDFSWYLLMTGYLTNITSTSASTGEGEGEVVRNRSWGEEYDEVVISWLELNLGLEEGEKVGPSFLKYREVGEGLRRVEMETGEGGGRKPSEYLHEQLTTCLNPTSFLTRIQATHQLIKDSVNPTSIFGHFLHHFHTTIDSLAFDRVINYLDLIRDYIREETLPEGSNSDSTIDGGTRSYIRPNFIPRSTSKISWDEPTRQSLARSPDLKSSIRIMEHYADLPNLTRETQTHFIRFVRAVLEKNFDESLNWLRHFSLGCIIRNSHYHPYALLNLGFLHYHFKFYQQSVTFFLDALQEASRTNSAPDCSYYALAWLAKHHALPGHPAVTDQIAHLLGESWYPSLLDYLVRQHRPDDFTPTSPLDLLLRHQLATSASPHSVLTTLSRAPPPSAPRTEPLVWSHYRFPTLALATAGLPPSLHPDHLLPATLPIVDQLNHAGYSEDAQELRALLATLH